MKTTLAKPGEVQQDWLHFDADGAVLGRMASRIALILQGKHRPRYTPHVDTGDYVVVTNAEKVELTGNKRTDRKIRWHSGWFGGLKEVSVERMLERRPEVVVEMAVRRMMPKTKLGRKMFKKLKVYAGPEHPHEAQGPVAVDMSTYRR